MAAATTTRRRSTTGKKSTTAKRGPGRPRGSRNKPAAKAPEAVKTTTERALEQVAEGAPVAGTTKFRDYELQVKLGDVDPIVVRADGADQFERLFALIGDDEAEMFAGMRRAFEIMEPSVQVGFRMQLTGSLETLELGISATAAPLRK